MTDLSRRAERRRVTRSFAVQDAQVRAADDGKSLTFTGYASVTDAPYEMRDMFGAYSEVIDAGAFARTLSQDPDVVFLVNHVDLPLARTKSRTLSLVEDGTGLRAEASFDPEDPDVARIVPKIERGDLDEMSFAFWIERQTWSPDYMQVNIHEVNLHRGDVSIVTFGANPHTGGLVGVRSLLGVEDDFDVALDAVRAGEASAAQRDLVKRAAVLLGDLVAEPEPVRDPSVDLARLRLELAARAAA